MGFGLRIGMEIFSAVLVGSAIGYLLDYWLGTKPWLMVLFVIFGFIAGFRNIYRAVAEDAKKSPPPPPPPS
uniref:ATP synthase protein I n=1 Tax=Magnetococcus massalia (strain MO-1) TaxID=451514 RepID=A0A1S7LN35_MAGMO|nr:protein of unknown function. Putative atpI. High conserved in the MTB [Candidatus Magnetococcus massalia]